MDKILMILLIKNFFLNAITYYVALKINKQRIKGPTIFLCFMGIIIPTVLYAMLNEMIIRFYIIFIIFFIQTICLKIILKDKPASIIITNLIANAITYVIFVLATLIELIPKIVFIISDGMLNLILIVIIEILLSISIFKIKKLKKGFAFLNSKVNNEYIDIVMIDICAIVILTYSLFEKANEYNIKNILIPFIMLGIIMVIMIQKTLTLYYKQKLLEKNIEDYKNDISERDAKIKKLSDEKFEISKLNHEFYNRQKSLELKVKEFVNNANLNTEIASELDVMEQIKNLSKEYSSKHEKIKNPSKLPLTEITEIDDMFKYMQNECKENNINFELQINGNIHHMVNNIIEQRKLVTLIGDHIRDSIIAVKSSNNSYRSIIAILGIKDNTYEFCVHDTGIEFGIETLLKLGVEPITTHKDEGGTGIGFITTFETLKETNSSLIIEEKHEIADNDYTKAVIIRFDGKHEYKIRSYRAKEINKKIKDREMIVENI